MQKISNKWQHVLIAYDRGYRILYDGQILSPTGDIILGSVYEQYNGYKLKSFSLRYQGKYVAPRVHKLQAYQKFGDKVFVCDVVRHKDGNSLNNSFDNILIGSYSDNIMDRSCDDRMEHSLNAARVQRKLTEEQVRELRRDREKGFTYKQLMEKYNIAKSTVSYIVNCKTYVRV